MLGFEWSSAQFYDPEGNMYGHKCVYYPGIEGDYYSHLHPQCNTPKKLWEKIKEFGGISIAHHSAYAEREDSVWGTRWDYHDDELQPLMEIYSKHGLSEVFGNPWPLFSQDPERFVQKALAKGYKLGFAAGTDRLEKVELIKNNEVIETKAINDEFLEFDYIDGEIPSDREIFYYVRVSQVDRNMAWSSPIWIDSLQKKRKL